MLRRDRKAEVTNADRKLLDQRGPTDWVHADPWRVLRIQSEFVEGFGALAEVPRAVSVFGSARVAEDSPEYATARDLGVALVRAGFAVITGGGPGIMEAANRGAFEVGSRSIGLNITLPHEQEPNPYITPELAFHFRYFALRKMHFLLRARALVVFPGGYGTLDELFEVLTLVQTRKMAPIPILLFGKQFWDQALNLDFLAEQGMIGHEDVALVTHVEQAEEAVEILAQHFNVQTGPLEACSVGAG